ncbi:hypothetical protein ACFQ9X_54315 [Catenulispora yoronensis]
MGRPGRQCADGAPHPGLRPRPGRGTPLGDPLAPRRESLVFRDWPAELFVHDEQSLEHWLGMEHAARKPTLHRMVGAGVALVGNPADWQERCRKVLETGPDPLPPTQRDLVRYGLTDLLDDLTHATDPGERRVIAAALWTDAAHQLLAAANCWNGTGKWLLRELRALDADLAERWLRARDDEAATALFAREVLDRLGGPLFDGFTAVAPARGRRCSRRRRGDLPRSRLSHLIDRDRERRQRERRRRRLRDVDQFHRIGQQVDRVPRRERGQIRVQQREGCLARVRRRLSVAARAVLHRDGDVLRQRLGRRVRLRRRRRGELPDRRPLRGHRHRAQIPVVPGQPLGLGADRDGRGGPGDAVPDPQQRGAPHLEPVQDPVALHHHVAVLDDRDRGPGRRDHGAGTGTAGATGTAGTTGTADGIGAGGPAAHGE